MLGSFHLPGVTIAPYGVEAASMTEPAFKISLVNPKITVISGLLAGLGLGPLVALALMFLPRNDWLGPFPAYPEEEFCFAIVIGLVFGLVVGAVISLLIRLFQEAILLSRRSFQHWIRNGQVSNPDIPAQPDDRIA